MGLRRSVLATGLAAMASVCTVASGAETQSLGAPLAAAPTGAVPTPRLKPPAPVSRWITPAEKIRLRNVLNALNRNAYLEADQLRQLVNDPVARSIADWAYFRENPPQASAGEMGAFLRSNFGWPDSTRIQQYAEKKLDDAAPETVLAFFSDRSPKSGSGHLALARALIATGNVAAGRAEIREAWVGTNWSATSENRLLSEFGSLLSEEDHWQKVDRQLFEIVATASSRLLPLLSPTRRQEARARIALLRSDSNAPGLLNNLPTDSAKDSGVLHAATRYYRRRGLEATAISYAGQAPIDPEGLRHAGRWNYERRILARWALKTGRFEDAYTLSAFSGLERGTEFAEGEFMAGWVALRFLGQPERAKAHFAYLGSGVTTAISTAKAEYWLARAYEATADQDQARQHYRVAAEFPFTYYGQLAVEALGDDAPVITFPEDPPDDGTALSVFEARPMVRAMHILSELNQATHFDRFARALDDQIESPGEVRAYYDLVIGERKTYLAVRGAKVARNNGAAVPSVIYPLIPVPQEAARFAEPPLILGLSRQESEFNPRAYSRARARGLMQLLASTARLTARKEGFPYSTARLMDDPNYNLLIGAAHLSHLVERFQGSYVMVLAGYNAGPHRVDQWIDTYGDPRSPEVDPIDWVELIPFSETRNYVMRVLENTQAYRARLNQVPLGTRLLDDLSRGAYGRPGFGATPPAPRLLQVSVELGGGPNILNRPQRRPTAVSLFEQLGEGLLHSRQDGPAAGTLAPDAAIPTDGQ